ncbi:rhamnan synthesis F family protein [Brevibacterium samyangense]|uniref:Uncharacterized protein n=1 Tax=Brevibacterium samyangense TaxID=366888 RepID=A0ABP5F579_9MICO
MSLLVVMAHHDPEGRIRPHALRSIERLATEADRFVLVSGSGITLEEQEFLPAMVEYERRTGPGHRFASYQHGLGFVGEAVRTEFDTVLLVDSSFIGPSESVATIVNGPATVGYEMVPLVSSSAPRWHPQPYFIGFKQALVRSDTFRRFWLDFDPSTEAEDSVAIAAALEHAVHGVGFRSGAYFRLTGADTELGISRVTRWNEIGTPVGASGVDVERWDPTVVLADEMIVSGRLPVVPIRALLEDPYLLDADRLLAAGEEKHPGLFDGVRESLATMPGLRRARGPVRSEPEAEAEGLVYGLRPTPA